MLGTESPLRRKWEMVTTLFNQPPKRPKELTQRLHIVTFPKDEYSYIRPSESDMKIFYQEIAYQINHSYYCYDGLICVLNGGKPGAEILAEAIDQRHLKDRDLKSIKLKRYLAGQKPLDKPRVLIDLDIDLDEQNVLIVEDVVDGGTTLKDAIGLVQKRRPKLIHTCSAFVKPGRSIEPTYFAETTSSWIIFPREENELHEFVYYKGKGWLANGIPTEEIVTRFQLLKFPKEFIEKSLATKPENDGS